MAQYTLKRTVEAVPFDGATHASGYDALIYDKNDKLIITLIQAHPRNNNSERRVAKMLADAGHLDIYLAAAEGNYVVYKYHMDSPAGKQYLENDVDYMVVAGEGGDTLVPKDEFDAMYVPVMASTTSQSSTTSAPATTSATSTSSEQPVSTTSAPATTSEAVSTTSLPVSTTSDVVSTTSEEVVVSSSTSEPVSTTSEVEVATTSEPATTSEEVISTTSEAPVSTTSEIEPVATTSSSTATSEEQQ